MVPYYFDIPELELPFDVDEKPYVQHPADYMSPTGLGLGGNSFQYKVVPENWYEDVKTYLDSYTSSLTEEDPSDPNETVPFDQAAAATYVWSKKIG